MFLIAIFSLKKRFITEILEFLQKILIKFYFSLKTIEKNKYVLKFCRLIQNIPQFYEFILNKKLL